MVICEDEMRKALRKFTEQQEAVLKENDYKHGWKSLSNSVCWNRALQEMLELYDAIYHGKGNIAKEACDVANFMMFIADNTSFEPTAESPDLKEVKCLTSK